MTFRGNHICSCRAINRLTTASASLAHDAEGRLRQTAINGVVTTLLHDGPFLIAARTWFHADHLGSIVAQSNGTGTATAKHAYGPYGEPGTAAGQSLPERFGYTGQQYLAGLNLYHYKARTYSPTLGRFIETDPLGMPDGTNRYAYVGNSPVNFTDPTGEFWVQAGMFAVGAGIDIAAQMMVGNKSWSQVNYVDAALSGAAAMFTGNVAAGAAKLAVNGTWSVGRAVTVTAGAGGVAGGAVPLSSAVLSSAPDSYNDLGTKMTVGAVSGMATAGAGARITASAAAQIEKLGAGGGVWSHIADTTRSAYSYGSFALGTTALSEIGKFGIDLIGAFASKVGEQSLLDGGGSSFGGARK